MSDTPRRSLPGWLVTTGWATLGVSALGLPIALGVIMLDTVWSGDSVLARRVLIGVLVVLANGLVIALERGLVWMAGEVGPLAAAGAAAGVVVLVLLGVFVPGVGIVLVSVGLLVGFPALLAGCGLLAWWRWKNGPRPDARAATPVAEVRAAAEARRAAVRARHDLTREAVASGMIGPGYTKGR